MSEKNWKYIRKISFHSLYPFINIFSFIASREEKSRVSCIVVIEMPDSFFSWLEVLSLTRLEFFFFERAPKNAMEYFISVWKCAHFWIYVFKLSLHKNRSFSLRISSANVTKSAVSCRNGHIYRRNP